MRVIYHLCRNFVKVVAYTLYNAEIKTMQPIDSLENHIVAANHIAISDPPLIGAFIPAEINFIAKAELFKNPVNRFLLHLFNAMPIRRGAIDRRAISIATLKLKKGQTIVIFPEGSRKSTSPKAGIGKLALETKTDILPVYIENSDKFFQCLIRKKKLKIYYGKSILIQDYLNEEINKDLYRKIASDVMDKVYSIKKELENDNS